MVKVCKHCNQEKEIICFGRQKSTKDGLRSWCKQCFTQYSKSWKLKVNYQFPKNKYQQSNKKITSAKRKYIQQQKSKPCAKCGIQLDPILMDFDHLSNKYKNLAAMTINSYQRINAEIAKCQVLCIFCHKEKTHFSKKTETIPTTPKKLKSFLESKWRQRFSILARSKPCYICNKIYPYYQMELDHQLEYQKLDNVSKLIFLKQDNCLILQEIVKCKPICCACHRLKSIQEKLPPNNIKNKIKYNPKNKKPKNGYKFCPQCQNEKQLSFFSSNGWCKECLNRYKRIKRKNKKSTITNNNI
jgi:hypothetical protein